MEDRDDGIGSEINTPRNVQHVEQLHHNSTEENENLDAVGDLIAAHSAPSISASSSTPIRPQSQQIPQHIPGISPIKRVPLTEYADDNALLRIGNETNNGGVNDQQYTKLDLAMMLRNKYSECIELGGENERLSQLVEKLTNENHDFQNQISVTKVCAATLAKETEELKKVVEENELKFRECERQLRMAEQKLGLLENISIDIETDKLPDAETLKKLRDENNTMQAKISELKLELEIEKEGEKNAEIWRKKYDDAEKDMKEMRKMKTELEKELDIRRAEISILNKEKKSCDEDCSKFKSLYNENAVKVTELQKQLHIIEERSKQLQEQDSKLTEMEQKLKTEKKVWEHERERLQQEKSGLEKRIEQLALANYTLSTEKQELLKADNKGLKDLAAWQEKHKKLTLHNAQLADELKKYRDMDLRLTECVDELKKKDSLIEELNGQITKINDELKKFRDETVYLRVQLNEKIKTRNEMEEDWALEKKKLLSECEHLKEEVAKNRTLVDQIGTDKQRNDELESLLEKRELELNNIRALMDKKQKRIDDLMEEKTDLKHENAHLKTMVDEIKAEYNIFRNQAEVQYQLETAQLNHIIEEKDERLERLHARIALYESYPGQSRTSFSCSVDAKNPTDITIWDALPASVRSELYELKEKYQDLNALVCRMMSDPPTKRYANIAKIMENKSTDCCGLALCGGLSHSKLIDHRDSLCEAGSSIGSSSGSLDTLQPERISGAKDTLLLMLDSIRHAEIRGKLSPNIKQLLEHLLTDAQEGDKSKEQINGAVSRFFTNLDLALRKTLSASDDNRIKCEKLEKLCMEMTADLHDARNELRSAMNKCSMYERDIDSLKLQFRCESQNCAELNGKLRRTFEEIDNLTKQKDDLSIALREAKIMLKRKTDLGSQAADTIKCIKDELNEAKKFEDQMNERLRKLCKEKEKVKQLLSERELDVVKLECRLVESTNECTARASELRQAESKIDELQRRNEYLKRKYEKRERFLEEMETLLRTMKIRCEGLQGTNQLRQNIIEKLKKLLVKLGCNLDNPYLIGDKRGSVFKSSIVKSLRKSKTHMRPSHLKRLKLAKIARRFEKDTAKIKDLEKCRGNDNVHAPSWRSLNNSVSVSPASSRAGEELNNGVTADSSR